jgi:hypothetical protein
MKISDSLQNLMDAAFIDGKLSSKEKTTLIKKAESEGLDKDEFELYLVSIEHENKKKNDIAYSVNPLTGEKTEYSKKRTTKVLIGAIGLLIVLGCAVGYMSSSENSAKESAAKKYDCSSFEECLSEYQFDGAYYYYSKDPTKEKEMNLVNAQVIYWAKEKNFEKAFDLLQEYKIEANYNLNTGDQKDKSNIAYNEQANFYNNLLDDIINKMLTTDQPKESILGYCKAFKPIVVGNEKNKDWLGYYKSSKLSDEHKEKAVVKVNEESKNIK